MNITTTLYTDWYPADTIPSEEKQLKKYLESGKAAIIIDAGLQRKVCSLTKDAVNTGTLLFIKPVFWKTDLYLPPSKLGALQAIGYLAAGEGEDAGAILYQHCIEDTITLAETLWNMQCRFNENYTGIVTIDRQARLYLQSSFPDISIADTLMKYLIENEKKLKADINSFEKHAAKDLKTYRTRIISPHVSALTDEEYLIRFSEDKKILLESYRLLKTHLKEMKLLPAMFGCTNYLLRGGTYTDIKGICRVVDLAEIEQKNWSTNPDDYV